MKKFLISAAILIAITVLLFTSYKSIFIRTVNYEIAGMKIPSKYNLLTGEVKPINNYRGRSNLPTMQPAIKGNLGLSSEQADAARLRWALFEQWAGQTPKYKDWETNPETFREAMAEFRKFVSGE